MTNYIYPIGAAQNKKLVEEFATASSKVICPPTRVSLLTGSEHNDLWSPQNGNSTSSSRTLKSVACSDSSIQIEGDTKEYSTANVTKHPKTIAIYERPSRNSYLNRHSKLLDDFRQYVLPAIVNHKLKHNERTTKIGVIGPGFDEVLSVQGAVIQEFEQHAEWGKIEDWEIFVDGFEYNLAVLMEVIERVNGRSPIAFSTAGQKHSKNTVAALNRHREWVTDKTIGYYADGLDPTLAKFMSDMDYDAIFMNDTFSMLTDEDEAKKVAKKFRELEHTFFIGESSLQKPIPYLSSHSVVSLKDDRYAMAIPFSFQDNFDLNASGLHRISIDSPDITQRLKILILTTNLAFNYFIGEAVACWNSRSHMNPYIVGGEDRKRNATKFLEAQKQGFPFHIVFIDNMHHDPKVTELAKELKDINPHVEIFIVFNNHENQIDKIQNAGFRAFPISKATDNRVLDPILEEVSKRSFQNKYAVAIAFGRFASENCEKFH